MSGKQLAETLRSLGYPGADSLDPESLDWVFENEALAPILQLFCHNVSESNLLQQSEIEKYNNLCQSGDVILTGRQLDEALGYFQCNDDDNESKESLQEEVAQLEADLHHYKSQKSALMKRRQLLSSNHAALSHRLYKLSAVESNVKQEHKKVLAEVDAANSQMNEKLEGLTTSVSEMSRLYDVASESNRLPSAVGESDAPLKIGSRAMFLSQVPLQQYASVEENFTTQLTAYTKKQFFQGISEMVNCGEDSQYEILEVSDLESLLVRGENQDVILRDCKELARLQALFERNESERICTLSELKKVKAQVQCANDILQSLQEGTFSLDIKHNRERLQKLQTALPPLRGDLAALTQSEMPQLLRECKDAKMMRVLTGDYNLKLARQDYFTMNQDKVIHQLIVQRSRNEMLTMSLEVELRRHRKLHHLLKALYTQLHSQHASYSNRMSVMEDSSLTPARHQRETVASRDKSTARLHQLLDEEPEEAGNEKPLFLTYSSLVEKAEHLQQRHAALTSRLSSMTFRRQDRIHMLETGISECESLVYEGSSTTGGQPLLTLPPIHHTIIELQDSLKELENNIMAIVKDVESKKKLIRSDVLLARERKLFTYFFTSADKLNKVLQEMTARVEAEKHVGKS